VTPVKRREAHTGRLRSTVAATPPPRRRPPAKPPQTARPPAPAYLPPSRRVAQILDTSDKSLADVLDSLLNKGVVLNADLILALANVDLIYIRLSALICAADRIAPREGGE
jgi:hypothetical protein